MGRKLNQEALGALLKTYLLTDGGSYIPPERMPLHAGNINHQITDRPCVHRSKNRELAQK